MRTISFFTIDKEFTVCIGNHKTLLNIKISILDLNKDFTCSTQKEITKPYSIKISILNSIKYKVSQFLWSKIIRTRELMREQNVFTF